MLISDRTKRCSVITHSYIKPVIDQTEWTSILSGYDDQIYWYNSVILFAEYITHHDVDDYRECGTHVIRYPCSVYGYRCNVLQNHRVIPICDNSA